MAVGQVLVQLDRENLSERGAAAGDFLNEQLDDVPDGDDVHALTAGDVVERPLGECQRLGVVRDPSDRPARPATGRVPAGVEGNQAAEADLPDAASRELDVNGTCCRRRVSRSCQRNSASAWSSCSETPGADVDAVDSELGELVEDYEPGFRSRCGTRRRRGVPCRGSHRGSGSETSCRCCCTRAVDLAELLLDCRMAGGIHAGQATQADEAFEQRQWIRRRQLGRVRLVGIAALTLKEDVGAATDARERGAPDPVPERDERRENRPETVGAALYNTIEESACDFRAALDEITLSQQLEDLTSRFGGRKLPQRFGCGAGNHCVGY